MSYLWTWQVKYLLPTPGRSICWSRVSFLSPRLHFNLANEFPSALSLLPQNNKVLHDVGWVYIECKRINDFVSFTCERILGVVKLGRRNDVNGTITPVIGVRRWREQFRNISYWILWHLIFAVTFLACLLVFRTFFPLDEVIRQVLYLLLTLVRVYRTNKFCLAFSFSIKYSYLLHLLFFLRSLWLQYL